MSLVIQSHLVSRTNGSFNLLDPIHLVADSLHGYQCSANVIFFKVSLFSSPVVCLRKTDAHPTSDTNCELKFLLLGLRRSTGRFTTTGVSSMTGDSDCLDGVQGAHITTDGLAFSGNTILRLISLDSDSWPDMFRQSSLYLQLEVAPVTEMPAWFSVLLQHHSVNFTVSAVQLVLHVSYKGKLLLAILATGFVLLLARWCWLRPACLEASLQPPFLRLPLTRPP